MDNVERVKKVYFELYSRELGRKVIDEPEGWSEDFISFEKDKESKDVRKKIEIDLKFYGEASEEYLQPLYYGHGILPNCLVIKYEKSSFGVDETWELSYVQRLDLSTWDLRKRDGRVTLKAYEGGLFDLIKNRYDDEIDLLSEFSLDGDYLGPLRTHDFQATERKIFLESLLKGDFSRYRIGTGYWNAATLFSARPIPFEIVYKSDGAGDIQVPRYVDPMFNVGRDRSAPADPTINYPLGDDLPLFFEAEEPKTIKISAVGSFQLTEFEERYVKDVPRFYVRYVKSYKGPDGVQLLKENENIIDIPIRSNIGSIININWSKTIQLEKDESISMIYATRVSIDSSANFFTNGYANTWLNSKITMTLQDITTYVPTINKVIKPIDLFDRIVAKITGKAGLVKSEVFGDGGEFEFKVVDNGFMARGFPFKYLDKDGEEKAIQFNTSFKEAFEAYSALTPMCWFTQKEGNKEVVRVEPEIYVLGNFVGIKFDSADNIEETCSKNDQFSKIELGHEGDLEYEEVNGLNEPNGRAVFATHLGASINNTYSKVSPYNFDPLGYEITRRVYFINFPYEDTPRDENIWMHDAKLQGAVIIHRSWQDDFIEAPKGIFDPDSAWNLRHSPMNLLYRGHGYAVRRSLYHNTNNYIRFSASNANQNLVTFPIDDLKLEESGEIIVHRLQKQRVKADMVTMTVHVTPEIRKQIEGVNEKGVRNVFGLVEYPEGGIKKYGRIVKLSSGESSKLELIKAGV